MTFSKPFCGGIWQIIALLLGTLLLLAIVLQFKWRPIEQDIEQAANTALTESGLNWAHVNTHNRGRDVLVLGAAPNKLAVEQALDVVRVYTGVRIAEFAGTLLTETPATDTIATETLTTESIAAEAYTSEQNSPSSTASSLPFSAKLQASMIGDTLTLTGQLPDSNQSHALIKQAEDLFGQDRLHNQISFVDTTATVTPVANLLEILRTTPFISTEYAQESSGFVLDGTNLTLTGIVANDAIRRAYEQNAIAAFDGPVINHVATLEPSHDSSLNVLDPLEAEACTQALNLILETASINFEVGEATLKSESFNLLTALANAAKRCPDAQLEIIGHTDDTGDAQANFELSTQRAQSVKNRLTLLGLSPTRLHTRGVGAEQPHKNNTSVAGRAANRRIEFSLFEQTDTKTDKHTNDELSTEPSPSSKL